MATKQVNITAEVDSTLLQISVIAAAGSAGTALPISTATSAVMLTNTGMNGGVEYQVGSGAWTYLEKNEGNVVNADLSATTIKLRLIADGAAAVPVDVTYDTIPAFKVYPGGPNLPGTGGSYTLPVATTAQLGGLKPDQLSVLVDSVTGIAAIPGSAALAGAASAAYNDTVGLRTPGIGITVPAVTSRQTLSRFDLATNTQPAGASDRTDDVPQFGTSSVRFLIGNGATTTLFPKNAVSYSTAAVDVTDKYITLRIRQIFVASSSIELANVGSIQLRLHNEATPTTASANYMRAFCGKRANGDRMTGDWQNIRIPIEEFGVVGTIADVPAFLQSVRYASVSINHVGTTSDTLRFGIASVTVEPKLATKGMCILSFDDCRLDTFTYAAALMARYGFVGVLYPGAFREDLGKDAANKMNIAQLRALVAQGWQVGSQAWDTEAPAYSLATMAGAMSANHNYMLSLSLPGSVDGSYFSNVGPGSTYQTVFNQMFRTMRDYSQFTDLSESPRCETCPPSERQMLKCYGVFTTTNSATNSLIPYAQKAADQKGCAIYSWHALSGSDTKLAADGGTLTSFEKFLEWLDQHRDIIEVVTTDTWIRRMGAK